MTLTDTDWDIRLYHLQIAGGEWSIAPDAEGDFRPICELQRPRCGLRCCDCAMPMPWYAAGR